jgi:GDP-L-fucose synthase
MDQNERVYIAGHNGMVGSALLRKLQVERFTNLVTAERSELDLSDESAVKHFFRANKPTCVILAAAKVGGIQANLDSPTEFLLDNLKIQNNVIMAAFESKVKKFCFLGSSCVYPTAAPQPMKEHYLLTGPLEPTNEGYALAKIAGLRLVQYLNRQYGFPGINLIPCNLYGPNDSFSLSHSHVFSALVRKFSEAVEVGANEVVVWGTGNARREFMNVDDLAGAAFFLLKNYDSAEIINVGTGEDVSIAELANLIAQEAGYRGRIIWDNTKPDGMVRKCMDVTKMRALGFEPKIDLRTGVQAMLIEFAKYKKRSWAS